MSQQNVDKSVDEKKPKAVALLSGGLDSSLAVRMMLEQGVEIEAVAIKTPNLTTRVTLSKDPRCSFAVAIALRHAV